MKGDGNMSDLNKLEERIKELEQKKKQLAKQLAETKRKRRTRALILFAEQIITLYLKQNNENLLKNFKIVDAKGEDYTADLQEEIERIKSKIQEQKPETQEQNQNKEGENPDFFASVKDQGSGIENQNADL